MFHVVAIIRQFRIYEGWLNGTQEAECTAHFTGLMVVTFTPVKAFILLDRLRDDWCIGPHQSSSLPACTSTAPICVLRSRLRVVHCCPQQIDQRAV